MAVIDRVGDALRTLTADTQDAVVYECRQCGETLQGEDADCPTCGTTDVAEIRVD